MPKGQRPDWNVAVKIGNRWETLGAGWNLQDRDGVSIKLAMIPVGFDGSCVLLPFEDREER